MSLINQILKELDKNHQAEQPDAPKTIPVGLGLSSPSTERRLPIIVVMLSITTLLVMGLIFYVKFTHATVSNKAMKKSHQTSQLSQTIITASNQEPKNLQLQNIQTPPTEPVPNNEIKNVTYELKFNRMVLNVWLDKPAHYEMEHNQDTNQFLITIADVRYNQNSLPNLGTNQIIKSLKLHNQNNDTEIAVEANTSSELTKLDMLDQPSPHLVLEVINPQITQEPPILEPQPIDPQPAQTIVQEKTLTPEEIANQQYLQITELYQKGETAKATKMIDEAMSKNPDDFNLIVIKAHFLLDQKQDQKALELLQRKIPTLDVENLDYYALLASLEQRLGNYQKAAVLYHQLTEIQTTRSLWWVGLGAALEAYGATNSALEAYQRALHGDLVLDANVRNYIEQKVIRASGN